MNTYARYPVAIERGKGSWVWDFDGKKYLDFTGGIAVNNLGHSHPKVISTIKEQIEKIIHFSNLFYIEPQARFAEILVENSFADKVFFCNSGAEATEGAIKLARRWGRENGGRFRIISAKGSFHGRTMGSLSATGQKKYQDGYKPMLPGFKFFPYGDTNAIGKSIDEKTCAVMLEPIQGENGVIIPRDDYLRAVREICYRNNILLILDEVQVGLGRTGKLFAYEHYGIEPDIMAIAKSLGGGIPAGAVLARGDIAKSFTPGSHGSTLGGNPLATYVGYKVVETILKDGLLNNCTEMGAYFLSGLKNLKQKYTNLVKDVRGKGLIIGVELAGQGKTIHPMCIEKGLLTILTVERVLRILPPLTVSREEIDFALQVLDEVFQGV